MSYDEFVITDISKGLYFAQKQIDRFTRDSKHASRWIDEDSAQKILNQIAEKPAIKQKAGKLTVMELQDAKKKIAQNANHRKSGKSNMKNVEKLIVNDVVMTNSQEVNEDEIEHAKLFNGLKSVCLTMAKIQQEELQELPHAQEALYTAAAALNEKKNSISKKIKECDNRDLDFLHVIELGKFDAVEWTKLIILERENRQKRRQYKDEWLAINTLFPNPEPDMTKIKSRAKKCLETIELVEDNNRKYTFRDKESKKQFGNLLK